MLLNDLEVDEMRALVAGAMESELKPLVYREPLDLVVRHRERGEPVYIVSAALQEIVEPLAVELGFDGAVGSVLRGRRRPLHGPVAARLPRRRQGRRRPRARRRRGHRPGALDRVLGQPHRPALPRGRGQSRGGQPRPRAAPDRPRARLAVLVFSEPLYPVVRRRFRPALLGSRSRWARPCGPPAGVRPEQAFARSASPSGTRRRWPTTSRTPTGAGRPATGSRASNGWRALDGLDPEASPERVAGRAGIRALGVPRGGGLPGARRRSFAPSWSRRRTARAWSSRRAPSRPGCSATGSGVSPRAVSLRC